MVKQVIISTTGTVSPVKLEELGAYFEHPTTGYTLSDYFDLDEIENADTLQQAMDNGELTVTDENGNVITSLNYLTTSAPVFEIDNVSNTKSYVGYGEPNACKIHEITSNSTGYTAFWAGNNESFDKIWSGRTDYSYF
jgi:hypothetical protein